MIPRPTSANLDTSAGTVVAPPTAISYPGTATKRRCFRMMAPLERLFYLHGRSVARRPTAYICGCLVLTALCSIGMIRFRRENTNTKLWIAENSAARKACSELQRMVVTVSSKNSMMNFFSFVLNMTELYDTKVMSRINSDWLWDYFPPTARFSSVIFESANVLEPDVLRAMYRARKEVSKIKTESGKTWEDFCMTRPIVKPPKLADIFNLGRKRRELKISSDADNDDVFSFEDMDDIFKEDSEEDEDFLASISAVDETRTSAENSEALSMAEYFSAEAYPDPYCTALESLDTACIETSILELWANDGVYDEKTERKMETLTLEESLRMVNEVNVSGIFLTERDFVGTTLSGIERDDSGRIVGAKAAIIRWIGQLNSTSAKLEPVKGRGEPVDQQSFEFEGALLNILLSNQSWLQHETGNVSFSSYTNARRSFGDVASVTILGDVAVLGVGYGIVLVYVMVMLGNFNCLEQRAWLSLSGVLSVVMGIIVAYGLCSAIGLFFGPLHNVLPFLLLGIGIDDMFVIVQCLKTADEQREEDETLDERIGRAMEDAGVAIAVTSLTDVVAFGVGGSTVLPALRSFCFFASVGIIAIFFFQLTFFVAWLTLDQRRLESRRNGCLCCCVHGENYKPSDISQKSISTAAFRLYGKLLTSWPVKLLILLAAVILAVVAGYGNILLRQEFNPTWFLPTDSYVARWFVKNKEYFPFGGDRVAVYLHEVDYTRDLAAIQELVVKLEAETDIIDEVDAWTTEFIRYHNEYFISPSDPARLPHTLTLSHSRFSDVLSQFLFSPIGGLYRRQFSFGTGVQAPKCGEKAPNVSLSSLTFVHRVFSGPEEHLPAMRRVKDILASVNLTSGRIFPLSEGYTLWETDEVIATELYRNLGLALLCVFLTTLFLLSDLLASIMVLGCVILSLVGVGGLMHFWGLTIDTVSCVNLIIAIGLCVDYSCHIAHRFLVEQGSRNKRVEKTLVHIGPAVLNGGTSTFLAFALLANSKSHVFKTFFKIFFLVVTLGLFHGLAVLPAMLSIVGPKPHQESTLVRPYEESTLEERMPMKEETKKTKHDVNDT